MDASNPTLTRTVGWNQAQLDAFCRRWRVVELAVFGSAVRGTLRDDSDLDVLVAFASDASWSLIDLAMMKNELAQASGRPIDLFTRNAVEASTNPIRRDQILRSARVLYAA